MESGWFVDPLGRFDGRYFDGITWTDQVSDDGRLREDPEWPPQSDASDQGAAPQSDNAPTPKDRRRSGTDRRSDDADVSRDLRSGERRQVVIPK